MSNNIFDDLQTSLQEATAYKNGDRTKGRAVIREIPVPDYLPEDIVSLRQASDLTQRGLATVLGVSPRTVEAWEAGKNVPSGPSKKLLFLMEKDKSLVKKLVASG